MRCLDSLAGPDDINALQELGQSHQQHVLPVLLDDMPPPLVVNSDSAFPRASSPGEMPTF